MIINNRLGLLVRGKMGSNPYRFVPYQWLTAANTSGYQYSNNQKSYHSNSNRYQTRTSWHSSSQSEAGSQWTDNSRTEYGSFASSSRRQHGRENGTEVDHEKNDVGQSSRTPKIPKNESDTKRDHRYREYDQRRNACCRSQSTGMSSSNLYGSSRCERIYSSTHSPRYHFSMHHRWLKNRSPFDETSGVQEIQRPTPSVVKLNREWEDVKFPDHISKSGTANKRIRIVCYNILSQTLLEINDGLYRHCDPAVLSWEYRWTNLKKEMEKLNADVLCLQEIEEWHYHEQIHPWLEKLGYECHYKKRTGNNRLKPDGVLTAFKTRRFKLVKERKVAYFRSHQPLVNQHNVGVITLLQPVDEEDKTEQKDNNCICIANTHLLYSPKRGDTKLVQLCTLFAEIDRLVASATRCQVPIVLCGDFNSVPHSYLYDFITKQELVYEDVSNETSSAVPYTIRHELGDLRSVLDHTEKRASTIQDRGITVDYIFYTPPVHLSEEVSGTSANSNPHPTQLHLSRRLNLVCPEELDDVEQLPNAEHSSDHIPVVAEFILVPMNS